MPASAHGAPAEQGAPCELAVAQRLTVTDIPNGQPGFRGGPEALGELHLGRMAGSKSRCTYRDSTDALAGF